VIEKLQERFSIYLLGGKEDQAQFIELEKKFRNVRSTCQLSLVQQVALISKMAAVISMDSGNMHLAAIQGIPVISIWGATHPYFGFSGVQTDESSWISTEKSISCRPCSVFGNKPCANKNEPLACLNNINPEKIISATESAIRK
jgi:ADP-heptose:LPS heptosyltransferase